MSYNRIIEAALSAGPIGKDTAEKVLNQLFANNNDGSIQYFPVQLIEKGSTDDCSGIIMFQGKSNVCNIISSLSIERAAPTVNTEDDEEKRGFGEILEAFDSVEDSVAIIPEDSAAKVPEDSADKVPEDSAAKVPEDSAAEVPEDSAAEVPGDSAAEVTVAEDAPETVAEDNKEPETENTEQQEPAEESIIEPESSEEPQAEEEAVKETEEEVDNEGSPVDDEAFAENGFVSPEPGDEESLGQAFTTTEAIGEMIETLESDDAVLELENKNISKLSLMKLHNMSMDFPDIPDEIKFAMDGGDDIEAEKNFINRGKTFHARKARRHRLRRWQEEMTNNGLNEIVEAMKASTDVIADCQEKFLRRYNAHKSMSSES